MAIAIPVHWHMVRALAALTAKAPLDIDLLMDDLELEYEELAELLDRAVYILGNEFEPFERPPVLH